MRRSARQHSGVIRAPLRTPHKGAFDRSNLLMKAPATVDGCRNASASPGKPEPVCARVRPELKSPMFMTHIRRARCLLAVASAIVCLSSSVHAGRTPETGEDRQPRNIYELGRSFDHTFQRILTLNELEQYRNRSPEQIKEEDPELYARISQDVKAWTILWIHHVRTALVPIPEKRMEAAHRTAER